MTIVYRCGHANLVHKWLFPGVVYQSGLAKMVHKQCFLRFVYQMMCMKMVHKHRFPGIVYQISAKKNGTQTIFFAFVYQSYHFMSSVLEHMEPELGGQVPEHCSSCDAVSFFIKGRSVDADTHHFVHDGKKTAADSRLGGESHFHGKLA